MDAEEVLTETRAALREAEELLDKLPPLSPDHEAVRTAVVQLRHSLRNPRGSSDSTKRGLAESRNKMESSLKLIEHVDKRVRAREKSAASPTGNRATELGTTPAHASTDGGTAVFLDLDTVLLDRHPGKYGPELSLQADISDALKRLSEVADKVIVVANPKPPGSGHVMDTAHRLDVVRSGLDGASEGLLFATCSHGENGDCRCAKPGNELITTVINEHGFDRLAGWYIGGDQEGVVAGRTAGLSTIRVGPHSADHLSEVHRADHEARDLMDAANRIMLETLAAD